MRARGLVLALVVALAALDVTERTHPSAPAEALRAPGTSLLALGDTGKPWRWPALLDGQTVVADAMVREASRRPVDAIVLLGDNFYFRGLDDAHLVERVRENVVAPYCYFVELGGPRAREVASSCRLRPALRHPVPFFAVLGNHDLDLPHSAALESAGVRDFVSNWTLPARPVANAELAGGVSLVLVDSTTLQRTGDATALRDALLRARGPWRVIVAHHPVGADDGAAAPAHRAELRWRRWVRSAIASAGVPVQLFLAGHQHSLQIIDLHDPPEPGLVVVAGGGSSTRRERAGSPERRFFSASFGFARVDFLGAPGAERAYVTLDRTSRLRWLLGLGAEQVARWSVDETGGARAEAPGTALPRAGAS